MSGNFMQQDSATSFACPASITKESPRCAKLVWPSYLSGRFFNHRQDPNAQPYQIENYEEVLRPCGETKRTGKPILKSRNKLLREMQKLRSQPDQKEARLTA
jgi:hypothetical protein